MIELKDSKDPLNIDNKYFKWYWEICERAKTRVLEDKTIYTERHHVYPKSIYGENNDMVVLTGREHFIVHHLLWWGYREEYGINDYRSIKMACAFTFMSTYSKDTTGRYKVKSSYEFQMVHQAKKEAKIGFHHSEETKLKLSLANKGKKQSEETIEKKRLSIKGLKRTEETKAKMRIAQSNMSDETKRKISEGKKNPSQETRYRIGNARRGCKLTEETKQKISNTIKQNMTDEKRAKISAAGKGRKRSPETQAKINLAVVGSKRSKETREKMSLAQKGKKHTEESKAKMSLIHKNITEETREKMRLAQYNRYKKAKEISELNKDNKTELNNIMENVDV